MKKKEKNTAPEGKQHSHLMEEVALKSKHNPIAMFLNETNCKDQIQETIAIPLRFIKKARLLKSSASQLFTMISQIEARL